MKGDEPDISFSGVPCTCHSLRLSPHLDRFLFSILTFHNSPNLGFKNFEYKFSNNIILPCCNLQSMFFS